MPLRARISFARYRSRRPSVRSCRRDHEAIDVAVAFKGVPSGPFTVKRAEIVNDGLARPARHRSAPSSSLPICKRPALKAAVSFGWAHAAAAGERDLQIGRNVARRGRGIRHHRGRPGSARNDLGGAVGVGLRSAGDRGHWASSFWQLAPGVQSRARVRNRPRKVHTMQKLIVCTCGAKMWRIARADARNLGRYPPIYRIQRPLLWHTLSALGALPRPVLRKHVIAQLECLDVTDVLCSRARSHLHSRPGPGTS